MFTSSSDVFEQAFWADRGRGLVRTDKEFQPTFFPRRRKSDQSTAPRHGRVCPACGIEKPMTGICPNC